MNGGNDTFSATGDLAALIKITVDGGTGNDTILGSNGADKLLGGDGDDFIDGQQGNDVDLPRCRQRHDAVGSGRRLRHGRGWGRHRHDAVQRQRRNEIFTASANGGRVVFTRNLGSIVMDLNDVEKINLNALGGVDTVTLNDLSRHRRDRGQRRSCGHDRRHRGRRGGGHRDRERDQRRRHHRCLRRGHLRVGSRPVGSV